MLKGMSNSIDGAQFILQLWDNAYGPPVNCADIVAPAVSRSNGKRDTSVSPCEFCNIEELDLGRREYLASWANYLTTRFPFVGILALGRSADAINSSR